MSRLIKETSGHKAPPVSFQGASFLNNFAQIKKDSLVSRNKAPETVQVETYLAHKISNAPPKKDTEADLTPDALLYDARMGLYRIIVAIGASTIDYEKTEAVELDELSEWKAWIGTLAHLVLKEHVKISMVKRGIKELDTSLARNIGFFKRQSNEIMIQWDPEALPGLGDSEVMALNQGYAALARQLGLPIPGVLNSQQHLDLAELATPTEMAAYYGLVVYLCGRPVSESLSSISVNRPKNLQDKLNNKQKWSELSGSIKMSSGTLARVGQTWELDPAFRHGYFEPLIAYSTDQVGMVGSAISMIINMLPFSQMNHVKIINDLIVAHPYVSTMKTLQREIYVINADSAAMLVYPASKRLFMKALERDQLKVFDSRVLKRLTQLATDVMGVSDKDLQGYAISGAEPEVMDEFSKLTALYGPSTAGYGAIGSDDGHDDAPGWTAEEKVPKEGADEDSSSSGESSEIEEENA